MPAGFGGLFYGIFWEMKRNCSNYFCLRRGRLSTWGGGGTRARTATFPAFERELTVVLADFLRSPLRLASLANINIAIESIIESIPNTHDVR